MPSFSTAQLAAIESGAYYACDLIEMDFTAAILSDLGISSPLHLCTAYTDLELTTDTGTHTYIGGKNGLLSTPNVTGNADNSRTTVDIDLSALNLLYVATVQDGTFINTGVRLYKCIFSSDTADSNTGLTIIGSPVQMFKGFIKGAQYNAGANDNSVIFNCHHFLFDDKTINTVRTEAQQYQIWYKNSYGPTFGILPEASSIGRVPFFEMASKNFDVRWGQK